MKKFYWKKGLPQKEDPILIRLERRHTVVEGNRPSRIKSSNSYGKDSQSEDKTPPFKTAYRSLSECRLGSNSSPASTVITERDLSNSWIYARSKAAAAAYNEAYEHSPTDDHPPVFSSEDIVSSTVQEPECKMVSVPLAKRRDSCSSTCCYFGVFLIICFCLLGILGVIGSIIYMEIFVPIKYSTVKPTSVEEIVEINTVSTNNLLSTDLSQKEEMDTSNEFPDVFDPDPEEKVVDKISSRRGKLLDVASNEMTPEDDVGKKVITERSPSATESSQELNDIDVSESKLDIQSFSGEEVQPSEADDKSLSSSSTRSNSDLLEPLVEETSIKSHSGGTSNDNVEENFSLNRKETLNERINTLSVNISENLDTQIVQFKMEESTKRQETSKEWSIIKDIIMNNFSTNSVQDSSTQVIPTISDDQENQEASERDQFDDTSPNTDDKSIQAPSDLSISNESNIVENSQAASTVLDPDSTPVNEFNFNHPIVRDNIGQILPLELLKRLELEKDKIKHHENSDLSSFSEAIKRLHLQENRIVPMSRAKSSSHHVLSSAEAEEERKNYKNKLRLMKL